MYHKNFLCWQLYRDTTNSIVSTKQTKWHSNNTFFYGHKPVHLLRKKQIDDQVTCTLSSLLCCRLREGYLIKRAIIRDDILEICFVLLWKSNVFLEHLVTCPWSSKSLSVSNTIQYTITIEGEAILKIATVSNISRESLIVSPNANLFLFFFSPL